MNESVIQHKKLLHIIHEIVQFVRYASLLRAF